MIKGVLPESAFFKYRAVATPAAGGADSVDIPSADKEWLVAMLTVIAGAAALQKQGGGVQGIAWLRRFFAKARSAAFDYLDIPWLLEQMSGDEVRARLVKSGHAVADLDDDAARTLLEGVRLEALRAQDYSGTADLAGAALVAELRNRGCLATTENAAEILAAVTLVTRHSLVTQAFGEATWPEVVTLVLGPETEPLSEVVQSAAVVARLNAVPSELRGDWDDPSPEQSLLIVQHLAAHPVANRAPSAPIERLLRGASDSDVPHALRLAGLRATGSAPEQRAVLDGALACLSAAAKERLFALTSWQLRCVSLVSVVAAAQSPQPQADLAAPRQHVAVDSLAQELLKKCGADASVLALPANVHLTLDAMRGFIAAPATAVNELQQHHGLERVQAWSLLGAAKAELASAGGSAAAAASVSGLAAVTAAVEPGAHALAKASASGAVDAALRQFSGESSLTTGEFLLVISRSCVVTVGLRSVLSAAQGGGSTRAVDLCRRLEKAMVRTMEAARSSGDLGASHIPVTEKLAAALRKEQLYAFVQGGGLRTVLKAVRPGAGVKHVWPVDIGHAALVVRVVGAAFAPYFGGPAVSGWDTFATWYPDLCFVVQADEGSHALLVDIVQELFRLFQESCAVANVNESAYIPPSLDFDAVAPRVEFLRTQVRMNSVVAQSLANSKSPAAPPRVSPVVVNRFFSSLPWAKGSNGDKFSKLSVAQQNAYKDIWLNEHSDKCFHKVVYGSCAVSRCTRAAFH